MNAPSEAFLKYEQNGAYHWRLTYTGGWRRSSPSAHARYDVVLDRVAARVPLAGARGLDIGCGDGVTLYKIHRRGGRAAGIDMEQAGLRLAAEMLRGHGAPPGVARASAYQLPFADGALDYVVMVEVLEHLDRPDDLLAELRRVIRPGGVLGLTTPHRLPSGVVQDPYHCKEYSGPELRELMERHFAEVAVEGQYPRSLSQAYHQGTGFRPADVALRLGVKAVSAVGLNPFLRWTTSRPSFDWEGLVAVGRKA
jgi:SAM-dependent methyltransferase